MIRFFRGRPPHVDDIVKIRRGDLVVSGDLIKPIPQPAQRRPAS